MPRKTSRLQKNGQVRIIAGQCRGRRFTFPAIEGLRPTSDRLRETLFNWLSTEIPGARCLDLFAGSGALGLEAASRGAAEVIFLEHNNIAARRLEKNIALLALKSARVFNDDALNWLHQHSGNTKPFDIIFLDPPFHSTLLADAIAVLTEQTRFFATNALIYIETPARQILNFIPESWQPHRHKTMGDVACHLYLVTRARSST